MGQSKRSPHCWLKKHKRVVNNGERDVPAVAKHCWKNGHRMDWTTAKVIDTSPFWHARCVLESCPYSQPEEYYEQRMRHPSYNILYSPLVSLPPCLVFIITYITLDCHPTVVYVYCFSPSFPPSLSRIGLCVPSLLFYFTPSPTSPPHFYVRAKCVSSISRR